MTCTCHAEPPPEGGMYEVEFLVTLAHPTPHGLDEFREAMGHAIVMARQSVGGAHVRLTAPEFRDPAPEPDRDGRPSLGAVVDAASWALGQGWAWLRGGRRG